MVMRELENLKELQVFNVMRMSGCIPTVQTYNVLILGLVEKRQMEREVKILDEMLLAGFSPNEHPYTTIMGKSFECFAKVKNEGLDLDVFTYEALLKACCKARRMQSALAVPKICMPGKFQEIFLSTYRQMGSKG